MEYNEFEGMIEEWLHRQERKQSGSRAETDWAVRAGITDGKGPLVFATREEVVRMIYRALEYFFGQIVHMLDEENEE